MSESVRARKLSTYSQPSFFPVPPGTEVEYGCANGHDISRTVKGRG